MCNIQNIQAYIIKKSCVTSNHVKLIFIYCLKIRLENKMFKKINIISLSVLFNVIVLQLGYVEGTCAQLGDGGNHVVIWEEINGVWTIETRIPCTANSGVEQTYEMGGVLWGITSCNILWRVSNTNEWCDADNGACSCIANNCSCGKGGPASTCFLCV